MPQDEILSRKLIGDLIAERKDVSTLLHVATSLNVAGAQMVVLELRVKDPGTIEF